jgi:hypothetical protein
MPYAGGIFGLAILALWVFCIVDVITTPEGEPRNLPKMMWLLLVIFIPTVGSIAWLIAGRPQAAANPPYKGNAGRFPEYDRPGRHLAQNPDDDEEFLRRLRERAEQQRRAAREQREKERRAGEDGEPPA